MSGQFGKTWWGRAWVDALEKRAELDQNRLARGRTYARQGRVARLDTSPGKLSALVRGSRALPYQVTVEIPAYDDDQWALLTDVIASKSAHAAALADGELDPEILEDARAVGLDLLPGPGQVSPRCACPDWADPCKHSAAVCYLFAEELDEDPFKLFELRGRPRERLLAQVRARRRASATAAASGAYESGEHGAGTDRPPGPGGTGAMVAAEFGGGAVIDPGSIARDAWSTDPAPLPHRRELPPAPEPTSTKPSEPPPDAPFSAAGLTELAGDAALRAWAQLADGDSSQLALDSEQDLARRAGNRLQRLDSLMELARRSGVPASQLTHQGVAWRHAGADGLGAIEEGLWRPPEHLIQQGLDAFEDAGIDCDEVQIRSNRLSLVDVQLRVTADGRWWRYEKRGRSWDLVEPSADDPADLVSG